jgi:hypothetical protein
LAAEEVWQNCAIVKTKCAIDQAEESASRTLKEIVQGEAKTLDLKVSVQEVCDELRSEGMISSPVTDRNGQLLGTVCTVGNCCVNIRGLLDAPADPCDRP